MNYLAHFHLAQNQDGLVIGALLGDYVKGPLHGQYPETLELGIRLHRHIDAFMDSDSEIQLALRNFSPQYRRYGGIMLDVFFDYLLCQHWQKFHQAPLTHFAQETYQVLETNQKMMPEEALRFAARMKEIDLLTRYSEPESINRALSHISKRLSRKNPLTTAERELFKHHELLERVFLEFYPRAQHKAKQWIASAAPQMR